MHCGQPNQNFIFGPIYFGVHPAHAVAPLWIIHYNRDRERVTLIRRPMSQWQAQSYSLLSDDLVTHGLIALKWYCI